MLSRFIAVLRERKLHLKSEWVMRLCREPVSSALAEPAIMAHLMDETLEQFYSLLRRSPDPRWLRTHPPSLPAAAAECRCGLNPLLAYFATGQTSVDTTLDAAGMADERERGRMTLLWHFLAQREIQMLCATCVRTCSVAGTPHGCSKCGGPVKPATFDAGVPGKTSAVRPRPGETPG